MTATAQKKNIIELFHDFLATAILYAVLLCWVLEASMNAIFGWRFAGGGLKGLPLAAVFVAIAVFAAYFPLRWDDTKGWARKAVLAMAIALCVGVSQYAGWANLGTLLADGATVRDSQATTRSTAADDVKRLRAELAGMVPPKETVKSLEAALSLEKRKTSKQYKDGDGPEALKIKQQIANAERYHALPGLIDEAQKKLAAAPQVADGSAETEVARAITGASSEQVLFWAPVVLTTILGFLANFGLRLIGVKAPPLTSFFGHHAPAPAGPAGHLPPPDIFDAYKGYDAYHPHARRASPYGGAYRHEQPRPEYPGHGPTYTTGHDPYAPHETAGRPVSHAQPQPPTHSPEHHGQLVVVPPSAPAAAPNNNPITINVGGATQHGAPGVSGAGAAGRRLVKRSSGEGQTGNASTPAGRDLAPSRGTSPSPAAAERPVDRDHVNQIIDHLVTFHAAEIIVDDGALVPLSDMVAHYRMWAKGRAIDPSAFVTMYPMVANVPLVDIGGVQHFWGVRLRHSLKVVSA